MERRLFIKGLGIVTVLSMLPLPKAFGRSIWEDEDPVRDNRPAKEHNYAMIIVQDRCIGCKACEKTCKSTWKVPQDEHSYRTKVHYIGKAQSFTTERTWLPVLCNQCDRPLCVSVCPTSASYKRKEDGIIMVDPDKCIGCKTCMTSCPYDARYYNSKIHSVDKCTFCQPRVELGENPACVEKCPQKVRIFGDLNDPLSEVSQILKKAADYRVLKPEARTHPNVFYTHKS